METSSDTLTWSAQFRVAPQSTSGRLQGDKITLPQSALEGLLAAAPVISVQNDPAGPLTSTYDPFNPHTYAAEINARHQLSDRQQQLPQPLTFRLVNPGNGRVVYAGIREFSANEDEVGLSSFLKTALGLANQESPPTKSRDSTPNGDVDMLLDTGLRRPGITVHAKQLPKGTYVRLRPLEAGYDPEDWKSLLERYLRDNFTTLTNGEVLAVPRAHHEQFRFLVDKLEPEGDGVCIVDTDLEVDIEALNEEQARETLIRKLAKGHRAPGAAEGSSSGGNIIVGEEIQGRVLPGDYVDYQLKKWDRRQPLNVNIEPSEDDADLDVFVNPFSAHQRSKPREDEHVFTDFSGRPSKRLKLSPTNVELEEADALYISVHAWREASPTLGEPGPPLSYTLRVTSGIEAMNANAASDDSSPLAADEVKCKNCHQHVPKRTLPLHEAFCYRNNVICPKCSNVFLKNSQAWMDHWHCPHDDAHGNNLSSRIKHDSIFHPSSPLTCPGCDFQAFNLPILAQHRTSTCPAKDILCQFCHLVVPQQGPDDPPFTDPEVLLSGLTPHELADGARTTECHLCNKIVRLRDMKTHLRLHDRDRITKSKPTLCANSICGRTIKSGNETRVLHDQLGLCNECFGPLYISSHDPEGKALRRRIERRLLTQLSGGCNKPWCANKDWCKTGHRNVTGEERSLGVKDALPIVKPVLETLAKGDVRESGLSFCVDEASQRRRSVAEMMAGEGVYEMEWCVKALEEAHGDLGAARTWLEGRAPRIGEMVR